jgi:hypothetical protein
VTCIYCPDDWDKIALAHRPADVFDIDIAKQIVTHKRIGSVALKVHKMLKALEEG